MHQTERRHGIGSARGGVVDEGQTARLDHDTCFAGADGGLEGVGGGKVRPRGVGLLFVIPDKGVDRGARPLG